eukprot:TRINITY_DN767_c0_g1_i3.p1 TRINITY_DN767_c0_g1~~TRINITY_DN767_c0_g1_i3.p1  ORF type:complete len:493 (+),score=74.22 TRINITY_DN767_c0_g1_i3:175-1479(+)
MYMPYHKKTVAVPAIPLNVTNYTYAADNAMVSIPAKCYDMYQAKLGLTPNWNDRQPGGPKGMFYFRISDPANEYEMLSEMGQSGCACGLVILAHGTSGVTWQSGSYGAMLSGMGYVVIAPDSHAMPASMGLKGVGKLKKTADIATANYCGKLNPYEETCGTWEFPFCYSTKTDNILNDRQTYREYVERNYMIRKLELDALVETYGSKLVSAWNKVFLLGRSEGAMTAARYYNPTLHQKLSGLILSGWSCEFNYFMSCADHAKVCGDQCAKTMPVLNINGKVDSYFGAQDSSVAATVAANTTHGYGGPITGNCRAAFTAQGFAKSTVVDFPGVSHSIMYSHDNALRSVLGDFLADPASDSSTWGSLKRQGCTLDAGIYECDADSGDQSPCVSYVTNPEAPFNFRGKLAGCAASTCFLKGIYQSNSFCGAAPVKAA